MSKNADLLARRRAAVPDGIATATPLFAARAGNAELWDADGRRFIDFAGGIAVLNTGHRHPRVIDAVRDQLDRYTHTAFQVVAYEPYVRLAERLNALAPMDGPAKTLLLSTGAEAVENAVKIARAATGRTGIIAFAGGFHGRTMLTMALTGKVVPYKAQFGAPAAGVFHAPFPCPSTGLTTEDSLTALDRIFAADIAPADVAAIIIEPVQGEGGFHAAPADLMTALRTICDRHGILLIADEVQTGFARTGRLFAMDHFSVKPDLMTVAKSLAGGFPLSAVIGRAAVMDKVLPGGLGGTYAGSPVACAAALAVLDVIAEEGLCERAERVGAAFEAAIKSAQRGPGGNSVRWFRRLGAMVAFDLVEADGSPSAAKAKAVVAAALDRGLILLTCGLYGNSIRLLVPLTVEDEVLREGIAILTAAIAGLDAE